MEMRQVERGRMTAVMRAVGERSLQTGQRVLRVGVLVRGRVIDERVIKQRTTVTVGASEDCTFVLSSLPRTHALFERTDGGYALNVLAGMTGRIALATGIGDLPAGPARIALGDDARGKIVIGDTTVLFQLVDPPVAQPRPQLPLGVKGGFMSDNDWALTLVAAFSLLVHFGLASAMYSDWSDPIVADRHDVAGLTDLLNKLPVPPVEMPESALATLLTPAPVVAEPKPKPTETTSTPVPPRTPTATPHGATPANEQTSDARAAQLAARAETLRIQTLVSLEGGPAVSEALKRSNVPGVDLSSAAEKNTGIARGNSELVTSSGGPVHASKGPGLSVLGGPTKTEGIGNDSGKQTATAGPIAVAQVGASNATVAIPNADGTIAALRARFRACYEKGLLEDSTMSGKVVISARVGVNGEVTSADVVSNAGLSSSVGRCIAGVVQRATFSAPSGGASTLQIPVTFVQSK